MRLNPPVPLFHFEHKNIKTFTKIERHFAQNISAKFECRDLPTTTIALDVDLGNIN
jgi:hypothetical protein